MGKLFVNHRPKVTIRKPETPNPVQTQPCLLFIRTVTTHAMLLHQRRHLLPEGPDINASQFTGGLHPRTRRFLFHLFRVGSRGGIRFSGGLGNRRFPASNDDQVIDRTLEETRLAAYGGHEPDGIDRPPVLEGKVWVGLAVEADSISADVQIDLQRDHGVGHNGVLRPRVVGKEKFVEPHVLEVTERTGCFASNQVTATPGQVHSHALGQVPFEDQGLGHLGAIPQLHEKGPTALVFPQPVEPEGHLEAASLALRKGPPGTGTKFSIIQLKVKRLALQRSRSIRDPIILHHRGISPVEVILKDHVLLPMGKGTDQSHAYKGK